MSAHQCPRCELKFAWTTELRWHLREEHPDFRIGDYPVDRTRPAKAPAAAPPR